MQNLDPIFIDKLYFEAVDLLNKSKNYLHWKAPHDLNSLNGVDSLYLTREVARLSARLTEVIAWILIQKARQSGEFSSNTLMQMGERESCSLDSREVCPTSIPPDLLELLDQTRNLYLRVSMIQDRMTITSKNDNE